MAHCPRSGGASRGVVKPPNMAAPGGDRANNGSVPLRGAAGPRLACDDGGGDRRRGCVPLGGIASQVHPPAHRFDFDAAKMPQPPSAIEPGKGVIPVNPWDASAQRGDPASDLEIPRELRR